MGQTGAGGSAGRGVREPHRRTGDLTPCCRSHQPRKTSIATLSCWRARPAADKSSQFAAYRELQLDQVVCRGAGCRVRALAQVSSHANPMAGRSPPQCISSAAIQDLTDRTDQQGRSWEVTPVWALARSCESDTPWPAASLARHKRKRLVWSVTSWSKSALETHFASMVARLLQDIGPLAGKTMVETHVDSWSPGPATGRAFP